jgi:hypothetical protein
MKWLRLLLLALSLLGPLAATVARGSSDHTAIVVHLDGEECVWWTTTRSHVTCVLDEVVGPMP